MAEPSPTPAPATGPSRPPALPSTADTTPYVPVSWMAVGSAAVAALFVLVLLASGYGAYRSRRPLIAPEILVLPAVAIVLSFAARRLIRDAEGTRTGELFGVDLPAAAWWTALVLGLGYVAYLFAIDYSVRRDAEGEVNRWVGYVLKDDVNRAFHRTLEPGRRGGVSPDDGARFQAEFRDQYLAFRQSDLVRVAERNKGEWEFVPGGLRDWAYKPAGVECVFSGTLKCPEGTFPVQIPLRATEGGVGPDAPAAGRQWQVVVPSGGYVQREQVRLTPYGWLVFELERQGGGYGRAFVQACAERVGRPYAYTTFARAGDEPLLRPLTATGQFARVAGVGVPTGFGILTLPAGLVWSPPTEVYAKTAEQLFTLPGGARPTDPQKQTFFQAWNTVGIVPAGGRLRESPDVNDTIAVTGSAVEVRVPVEIPLAGTKGEIAVARGRLLVTCSDPPILDELKRLKGEAHPDRGTDRPPDEVGRRPGTWRVVRIESDLKPVRVQTQNPGGPGGMPGMPGGPDMP